MRLTDNGSHTRQGSANIDTWQPGAYPSQKVPSSETLAFIAPLSIRGFLRVVVEQKNAPESDRASRDNADGGLYLNPEGIPCHVLCAYDSERDSAD